MTLWLVINTCIITLFALDWLHHHCVFLYVGTQELSINNYWPASNHWILIKYFFSLLNFEFLQHLIPIMAAMMETTTTNVAASATANMIMVIVLSDRCTWRFDGVDMCSVVPLSLHWHISQVHTSDFVDTV